MPARTTRFDDGRRGHIFIPTYKYKYNLIVEIDSDDVTNDMISTNVDWPVTDSLGKCTIQLDNKDGKYVNTYSGGEIVEIWASNTPIFAGNMSLHLKMNGDSTDSSGNGNDGSDNAIFYGTGKLNQSALFNGSSSTITASDNANYKIDDDFTIAFWLNTDRIPTADNGMVIIGKKGAGSGTGFVIRVKKITGYISIWLETVTVTASTAVTDGDWVHIIITRSGNDVTIYKNNVSVGTGTKSGSLANVEDLEMGQWMSSNAEYLDGNLDDLRIFQSVISSANRATIYNSGDGTQTPIGTEGLHMFFNGDSTDNANSNDGSDTDISYVSGKIGQGASFNGTTSKITIIDDTTIQNIFDGGGTISAWVNPNSDGSGDNGNIISKTKWYLAISNESGGVSKIRFSYQFSGDDASWVSTTTQVPNNTWTHIAITYDASSTSNEPIIYVNRSVVEISASTPTGTRDTDVGSDMIVGAFFNGIWEWDGFLDDVRLYSNTLTATNIDGIYNSGNGTERETSVGKIFSGKADNMFFNLDYSTGYTATIEARQVPEAVDKIIIEQYTNALISDAILDIVDKYLNGLITTTNVTVTTERVTTSFSNISPWKAISGLLQRAEQDGYIDTDLDLHTFYKGTVINNQESVVVGTSLLTVARAGTDNNKIKNRLLVYGADNANIFPLKTEEDTTSQSDLWQKDLVVNDSSILTMDEVQDRANVELLRNTTNISKGGNFSIIGSPVLNPGDTIQVSIPYCDMDDQFRIARLTHNLTGNSFITSLDLSLKQDTIAEIFKERVDAEESLRPFKNLNFMTDSYYLTLTESSEPWLLTDCNIMDGVLQVDIGQTEGIAIFDSITTDNNVTQCEFRIISNFPDTENDQYFASNDNGITWEQITIGNVHTFTTTGNKLALKILLFKDSTHTPAYQAFSLLYK